MTKKKLYGIVYQKSIYKILLTMKLTFLLTFVTVFQLAATGYSQKARVSIHVNNASYLDVFNEIEKQSEYRIFYKVDQLDPDKRFDLAVKNETVADVLRDVLSSSRSSFDLMDRIIVITPDALAQQKVTGRVTDVENGEPLPGVNISVEGTTTGVTTDVDGNYSITVPRDGKALIFSYVGYVSQRIEYTDQTSIDVELSPEVKKLDEVVVVGYGTQKRSDITGSVTSVPKDRLSKIPVTNLTYALEGSAAGLNVTQTSSVPGSSGTMRIRGVNSINASTSPFIVLDGIPFFGSMNDINPNDIESIEILKDASAVAIYGTRGANGVILITTKRGSETSGAPKITYNGYVGVEGMEHVLTPMDPATYVQKYADFNTQNGLTQTEVLPNSSEVENYNNGITTDWLKQATQTGNIQEHNLSISGEPKMFSIMFLLII
jgi:TonB-linked SusC/RagA family outer membrane protein